MSNVAEWLSALGLGRYTELFAEYAIDLRALPHSTDDDLSALQIPLGHRRISLAAVTGLGKRSATTGEAERRQLTILFSGLAGSTALWSRLDPDDMRDVFRTRDHLALARRYGLRFEPAADHRVRKPGPALT